MYLGLTTIAVCAHFVTTAIATPYALASFPGLSRGVGTKLPLHKCTFPYTDTLPYTDVLSLLITLISSPFHQLVCPLSPIHLV